MAPDMLSSLPVELLTLVAAHLEWNDSAACRLSCQRIEAALFPSFARHSFTRCRVMRTPESMQTLIDISKSRLSPFVTDLIVSSEVLSLVKGSCRGLWPSGSLSTSLTADQEAFTSTGCDRDMLTEALLNLKRVCRITVRDGHSAAPRNMSATPGDSSVKPRSLGLRKLLLEQERVKETGVIQKLPTRPGGAHSDKACLYCTLLALGKAGVRPKRLNVGSMTKGFDRTALHLPEFLAPSVDQVLAQVEKCSLRLSFDIRVGPGSEPARPGGERPAVSTYDIRTFLQRLTQIRRLSILLNGLEDKDERFVEWLSSAPSPEGPTRYTLPQSPSPVTFDRLQVITLSLIYGVNLQALVSLPRKFAPTLRELRLCSIQLKPSLPGPAWTDGALGCLWTAFLKSLKAELSDKLQSLCLADVMETDYVGSSPHSSRDRSVSFAKGQGRYGLCAYSGPEMKHAIEAMIHYLEGDSSWTPFTRQGTWRLDRSRDGI